MEKFSVVLIDQGERTTVEVPVSEEVPLTLEVNGKELATLLATPEHLKNLVTGFLFTSGFIREAAQIKSISIDPERWKADIIAKGEDFADDLVFKRIYTSGCGKGVIFHNPLDLFNRVRIVSDFRVQKEVVRELVKVFQRYSEEHALTHGVHSAALASRDEILIFRDDIGRHNAMDKVIGEALYSNMSFTDKILLTSGRISSEILSKVLRCRMPVMAAIGAPTNQAVKLARQAELTIAGLVRGSKIFVYSGEERLF
ncbi:MAG: FdhD protein [Syntrophaceae bacterium]|nr:MAG: FdhD protein [Syntrophaceae bacterium]